MKILLALAKSGSPERWDALPSIRFDNAKEGRALTATGKKKKKKRGRKKKPNGLIDTPLHGANPVISTVVTNVRFP